MNWLINLVTETGLIVDLILVLAVVIVYSMITADDKKLEELEGGYENEELC